jgi:hypothetical protein
MINGPTSDLTSSKTKTAAYILSFLQKKTIAISQEKIMLDTKNYPVYTITIIVEYRNLYDE